MNKMEVPKGYIMINERCRESEIRFSPTLLPDEIYQIVKFKSNKERIILKPSTKLYEYSSNDNTDKRGYKEFTFGFIQRAIEKGQIKLLGTEKELYNSLEKRLSQIRKQNMTIVDAIEIIDREKELLEIWNRDCLIEKFYYDNHQDAIAVDE